MEKKNNITVSDAAVLHPDYKKELLSIIRSGISPKLLKDKVLNYHENDIAAVLEDLSREERIKLYNLLDSDTLSGIFEYTDDFGLYFSELSIRKQTEILSHSEADTAARYLKQLSKTERAVLIDLMDDETKRTIALIGSFDDDEIGSRMTTNYIKVNISAGVRQAMRDLIEQAAEHDNVSTIYVVDDNQTFCGAIDLKDLIIARESTQLEDIISASYPYIYAQEQVDACIERIKEYSEDSIPVLNSDNKLIGVITSQDIVEFIGEAFEEDYARLAGLSSEEDRKEPLKKSIQKRLPWLIILLALGMIVSSVVGLFEGIAAQLTILVCFQSLVLDMSGNVGTQSLAITIRVLTDGHLTVKQKFELILKETKIGFINGIVLGITSFVLIGLYTYFFKTKSLVFSFAVSACIGAALLISMALASVAGTVIPIIFKKLKIDPAVASGPLITTVNDLISAVSYYGLSWIFLIKLLHL